MIRRRPLLELLFPPVCASCRTLLDRADILAGRALCPSCKREWESEKMETCPSCAKTVTACRCVTEDMEKCKCEALCKLVYYIHGKREPLQNRLIYSIKQERRRRTVEFLAAELAVSARDLLAEQGIAAQDAVLTYIPRATAARLQYGTDQARELARALSRELSIPMLPLLERRPRMGRPQKHLNSAERLKNAKKTYRVRDYDGCRAKTVLLVDDIVTSGATVAICARLLRRAGASHVFALAVAADELQSERGG